MTSKRKFTLVELLTVIAIIAVLAGILIPTVTVMRRRAQEATAKTEALNIAAAIKAYKQQYNKFPSLPDDPVDGDAVDDKNYEELMLILTADFDSSGTDALSKRLKKANPRKVKFLESRPNGDVWLDPFEQPYFVFYDSNYDGKVAVTTKTTLNGDVFVLSGGVDKKYKGTVKFDEAENNDNVNSWK